MDDPDIELDLLADLHGDSSDDDDDSLPPLSDRDSEDAVDPLDDLDPVDDLDELHDDEGLHLDNDEGLHLDNLDDLVDHEQPAPAAPRPRLGPRVGPVEADGHIDDEDNERRRKQTHAARLVRQHIQRRAAAQKLALEQQQQEQRTTAQSIHDSFNLTMDTVVRAGLNTELLDKFVWLDFWRKSVKRLQEEMLLSALQLTIILRTLI